MGCLRIKYNPQDKGLTKSWKIFIGGLEKNGVSQTQPLTPFLANLVLNVDGSSLRYLLEMGIEAKNMEIANLEKEYVQTALFDESIDVPYSKLAELYEVPEHLEQLQTAVSSLLMQKDYSKAQDRLDDYLVEYSDVSIELMQIQIYLAKNQLNRYQLNESQLYKIELLAADPASKEYTKANAVLDLINQNSLPSFEMPIEEDPALRLTQQLSYAPLPRNLMSISPNPSDGEIYVTYELPKNYTSALLVMHNNLGQNIASWDVSPNPQFYKLNCEGYPSGVYSLSLVVDGDKIETQQLTLITK